MSIDPTDSAWMIANAEAALQGAAVVPCMSGSLGYIKEVRDQCLRAGIPVVVAAPAPGRGWGTKAQLLVQEHDVPSVAAVLDREWLDAVGREGLAASPPVAPPCSDDDEPACPACGTAAALIDGACSDCGLQLEDPPASCGKPGCGTSGSCG